MHTAFSVTVSVLKLRIGTFIALAALVGILTGDTRMGWVEAAVFTLAVLGASGAAGAFTSTRGPPSVITVFGTAFGMTCPFPASDFCLSGNTAQCQTNGSLSGSRASSSASSIAGRCPMARRGLGP